MRASPTVKIVVSFAAAVLFTSPAGLYVVLALQSVSERYQGLSTAETVLNLVREGKSDEAVALYNSKGERLLREISQLAGELSNQYQQRVSATAGEAQSRSSQSRVQGVADGLRLNPPGAFLTGFSYSSLARYPPNAFLVCCTWKAQNPRGMASEDSTAARLFEDGGSI